jgi:hypothetical protein
MTCWTENSAESPSSSDDPPPPVLVGATPVAGGDQQGTPILATALVSAAAGGDEDHEPLRNQPAGAAAPDASAASSATSPPARYLVRFVRQGKFLDAAGTFLYPRNGQPSQEWTLGQGKIENPASRKVLAAEWSEAKRAYTGSVAFLPSPPRDGGGGGGGEAEGEGRRDAPADWTWDVTAEGTIRHRATGKLLGVSISLRGFRLGLWQAASGPDLHQWQLLPLDVVVS